LASPEAISAFISAAELCGCALSSPGGGLKSICESLLELSPGSLGNEEASTRSERGGGGFGGGAGAGLLAAFESGGCPCAGEEFPELEEV